MKAMFPTAVDPFHVPLYQEDCPPSAVAFRPLVSPWTATDYPNPYALQIENLSHINTGGPILVSDEVIEAPSPLDLFEFPLAGDEYEWANYAPDAFEHRQCDVPSSSMPETYQNWMRRLPIGVKFWPTDAEIIHYLEEYIARGSVQGGIIKYADIYDYEPDQLPGLAVDHGDGKMYFFTRIKKIGKSKAHRGIQSNAGHWRATQAPKPVKDKRGKTIGYKTPLTYKRQHKIKTSWLMSEYKLLHDSDSKSQQASKDEIVLAVVYLHNRRRNDEDDD